MIVRVRVVPRSKKSEVSDLGNNSLRVRVVSPPTEDRANKEIIVLLSQYYRKSKSSIKIKKGARSRDKLIEINDS